MKMKLLSYIPMSPLSPKFDLSRENPTKMWAIVMLKN